MTAKLSSTIDHLFAGGLKSLEAEGQCTGIYKNRIDGPARVERNGFVGDAHGDLRVHGGPEKAVHHYDAQNYLHLSDAFPRCNTELVPGSLGENISTTRLSERNVHIGDVFQVGTAILQVSQPRSPCWKINHRFGVERMSMHIAQERITGWYYRVLEPGSVSVGDTILLLERQTGRFSIDEFWKIQLTHRPSLDDLAELFHLPGLAQDWKRRLEERARWLSKQAASRS